MRPRFLIMILALNLSSSLAQAMEVQVFGRDPRSGEMVLRTGDLTPSGVFGGTSPKTQLALTGQGVGAIFGSIQFPQAPLPLLKPELPPLPQQPSQVRSSLDWVPDNFQTRDGLNYGGITRGASLGPASPPPSPSSSTPNVNGNFTLDGTVGGGTQVTGTITLDGKLTKMVMMSSPRLVPNPLPGTVGLFFTGIGAGVGALRILHRKRPTGT